MASNACKPKFDQEPSPLSAGKAGKSLPSTQVLQDPCDKNSLFARSQVASRLRNKDEFEREQAIERLLLSKDDKYVKLLVPYRHERLVHRDEVFQKTSIAYVCKYGECDKTFTKA
eukprot:CAMPEP_0168341914 /NCGR_PEP_ID=MMETSP0213-20121227/15025_1 /TAXON_ID=151035 /ORGANISM="Euplotes harpa, Strain FSP1.4" /LENGTH=114 /DNA_ID=CAMNT_0008348597 /DNA_START=148 /DNA_END=492 /DNA_ORIENTATION=+